MDDFQQNNDDEVRVVGDDNYLAKLEAFKAYFNSVALEAQRRADLDSDDSTPA